MIEPSGLYYPNRIARAFFGAMDDVMGQNGLATLLGLAGLDAHQGSPPPATLAREFDFAAIAAINVALEEMYGVRGGRGIALRIGQATFAQGIKTFGVMRAMRDPVYRALPLPKRARYGIDALALLLSNFTDQQSHIRAEENAWLFVSDVSPFAWGRMSNKPVCHMMTGMLIETLRWASNGYEFYVRETACTATGHDACVFRINQTPIGK